MQKHEYVKAYMSIEVVTLRADHWPRVREIYLEGIGGGQATFETSVPTWEDWSAGHHAFARLAATLDAEIAGWAALSPVSKRQVYAGVAEVSVYVSSIFRGRGLGRLLVESLIRESEQHGIWMLQASVFPENVASLELHRKTGFRVVGKRERIAKLNGVWRNTLLLERRSAIVGTS